MPRFSSPSTLLFDFFMQRKKIYIYGGTVEAKSFIKLYGRFLSGVIDRSYSPESLFEGVIVFDKKIINSDCIVINAISCANTGDVDRFVLSKGATLIGIYEFLEIISNNYFLKNDQLDLKLSDWSDFPTYFLDHISHYIKIFNRLDDCGKGVFTDYLDARITVDLNFLGERYEFKEPNSMYLQDFLPDLNDYTFVDIGGFDGGNTDAFLEKYPNGNAIIIEANKDQCRLIRNKFIHKKNVSVHNFFLGDSTGDISFIINGNASRKLEDNDDVSRLVLQSCEKNTLDNILNNTGDSNLFIKMDVEGAELDVLTGMAEVSKRNNTILAISIYHKISDFVDLWPVIEAYSKSKNITIRHLTSGVCETVLFIY